MSFIRPLSTPLTAPGTRSGNLWKTEWEDDAAKLDVGTRRAEAPSRISRPIWWRSPDSVVVARFGGDSRRQQPVLDSAPTSVRWWFPAQVAVFGANRRTGRGPDPTLGGGCPILWRFPSPNAIPDPSLPPHVGRRFPAKVAFSIVRWGFGHHLTTENAAQSGNRHKTELKAQRKHGPG